MNTFTLALNTATNVFGLFPVISCWKQDRKIGFVITLTSFIASCLMHITETKHELRPLFLAKYSNLFLNLDRLASAFSFSYGVWCMRKMNYEQIHPLATQFLIGTLALKFGEHTKNLYFYNILHTIWHYAAFGVLNRVIENSA